LATRPDRSGGWIDKQCPLAATLGNIIAGFLLGILIGAGYGIAFRPVAHAHVDSAMSAASLGIPLWGLLSVILLPLLSGRPLQLGMGVLLPILLR